MKTAISIPDDLFDSAEGTAHRLGMSRSELYVRALRGYLAEQVIRERLDEIYGGEHKSGLDPTLAELQRRTLKRGDKYSEGW